jgi:hypothetical protein
MSYLGVSPALEVAVAFRQIHIVAKDVRHARWDADRCQSPIYDLVESGFSGGDVRD